jgi:anti-anti-sigma factor
MATPLEELDIQHVDDAVLTRVRGEVDLSNVSSVRERLLDAVPNSAAALVLDLSETDYLDSSGIGLIFELAERLAGRGQKLLLVVPQESVIRRVLLLTDVEQVAPLAASVEAALRAGRLGLSETATSRNRPKWDGGV